MCWRVGAMVGARRGAVAAAGRQHVPPSTAGYHHVGRGFDPPARALPHQPQKQPPSLRVVLLSSLCRRRLLSSPSSFAVAVLLSFLCRRGLFCRFSSFAALPAAPCSPPPFAAAACLLPPLQAPSGTGAGTAGGAARGPVGGGGPVGAYRHLRLDPALLLAPVAAPRAAPAPVGGARCVHCQPGQGHLRWSKEGGGATSRRGGGCKNNH